MAVIEPYLWFVLDSFGQVLTKMLSKRLKVVTGVSGGSPILIQVPN